MNPRSSPAYTACTDREAQLEALLFSELDRAAETALREHVEHCSGCREALDDAQVAFAALSTISDPPLPYEDKWSENSESESAEKAWAALKRRLEPEISLEAGARAHRVYELLAMAAVLVIGIGLGLLATPPSAGLPEVAGLENLDIAPEALLALERAELLSDVGVRYVDGLQDLLVGVMELSVDVVTTEDLFLTRERASELLRDGRLLETALDADNDRDLLRAIRRAELFLEELAALESSTSGTGVGVFQASLEGSRLPAQLAAIDLNTKVSLALEASGWIGREERGSRKEF
ncbi:MAG: hypothetical protein E2P02_04735 [Acidobacteria bacterium]|nr:MAG: hypothetical protein E2P02_04735 [Acidobacteriota bacterium]